MILTNGSVPPTRVTGSSTRTEQRYGDAGGLTRLGFNVTTLAPGEMSARRHWHEEEDEFLYVISGEATVIEEDGAHVIGPGDVCCWPAGVANAHHVVNRSDAEVVYLVAGAGGATRDVCHYPDHGEVLHHSPPRWWMEDAEGRVLREGETG
ncbi:cupin domain-containing protein [Wenxinia saemankumensis]|uniref:Uncharacterized conserved protein, cupin superfamily n=1 Tax=Wenxinia saemankumensis TaxID=1447782 RepID=A0A1M6BT06_9RHOB|nr:cupin domain-containing protein [Wenxinia saemankumensis]SHI51909.1 Uncharacterized conserved protein, cupin superfamily [Wenxinia saemankumensis]